MVLRFPLHFFMPSQTTSVAVTYSHSFINLCDMCYFFSFVDCLCGYCVQSKGAGLHRRNINCTKRHLRRFRLLMEFLSLYVYIFFRPKEKFFRQKDTQRTKLFKASFYLYLTNCIQTLLSLLASYSSTGPDCCQFHPLYPEDLIAEQQKFHNALIFLRLDTV